MRLFPYILPLLFILFSLCIKAQNIDKISMQQLDSIYMLLYEKQDFKEALLYAEKRVAKTADKKDSTYGYCLSNLATVHQNLGNLKEAEALYEELLPLWEKTFGKKNENYIRTLSNLGVVYMSTARYEKAEIAFNERLVLAEKAFGTASEDYAEALGSLANIYFYMPKYEKAEQYYLHYVALMKKLKGVDSPEYASALNNCAVLYLKTGKYEQAAPLLKTAIEIRKKNKLDEKYIYANNLNNLGISYWYQGQGELAEPLFIQATELVKNIFGEEHPSYGSNLQNLAMFYSKEGQHQKAAPHFEKAISVIKKSLGEKHPTYATAINNYALSCSMQGKYDEAEKLYREATKIRKESLGASHPDYGISLFTIGEMYAESAAYTKAEPMFLEAAEIVKKSLGEHSPDYIMILANLAALYSDMKAFEKADSVFNTALKLNCKDSLYNPKEQDILSIVKYEFYSEEYLFKTLKHYHLLQQKRFEKTKDKQFLQKAYNILKAAMLLNERLRNSFSGESDKLKNLSEQNLMLSNLFVTATNPAFKKDVSELFSFAELNKSILLADATKAERARNLGDLPDSLALEELALQEALDELKKEELDVKDELQQSDILKRKNELNLKIDAFKKRLESNYPQYYKLKYAAITAKASEVQQLLDDKTLFLEYLLTDSTVYLFVLDKKNVQLIEIELEKGELKKQIKDLRKALSDYEFIKKEQDEACQLYTSSAYWFYEKLVAPALANAKGIEKLMIVADGELGHLPFEAFLTEAVKTEKAYSALPYLLHKYKVSYNYSATLWKENLANRKKGNGKILGVAASYKNTEEKDSTTVRANRAPHLRNLRDGLQDLPAAKAEVVALSNDFKGAFWQEELSTERNFKENAGKYGIIHLAMHGLLNKRAPILSSLAFTENGDSTEDNFLEAWEISHLKLNAELVVLSACETGYGKFQQGEGVMSLARSFMYAGVPSLVVSLWQVNDASASAIMQLFYKNLAKGMDKATALQQAKLGYMASVDNPMAAHPAFWAAFVQMGDDRPISIATKNNGLWWGIGLGTLLVAGLAVFVWRRKSGR